MNRTRNERVGRWAEVYAQWYLRLKGYTILEHRYTSGSGEIDIIARKKNVLAIIEVKRRPTIEAAEESLTPHALRRISRAADVYYARTPSIQNLPLRFDGIFITKRWHITHLKDLWRDV